MKLLIVDDSLDILSGITEYLSLVHTVTAFGDSSEAFDYMQQQHLIDLLITDYEMPGYSGLQLAEAASTLFPAVPVIVMTGASDISSLERSLYIQHILRKPFSLSKVAAIVQRFAAELMLD